MDKKIFAGIAIFFFSVTAHANGNPYKSNARKTEANKVSASNFEYQPIKKPSKGSPYFGVIAGASIAKAGELQVDQTQGPIIGYHRYQPNNNYFAAFLYGINGGYEFHVSPNFLFSLGLGIYQSPNLSSKGQRWLTFPNNTAPDSHQFDYEYMVLSSRLMLETQFAWPIHFNNRTKLIPFISLGAGPALNFVDGYEETAVASGVLSKPAFKKRANFSFAYQLGAGISCPFNNDKSRLSIAYRYVDLGRAHFNSRADNIPYQLDAGRIKANEIYLTYTHFFNP